MFNGNATPSSAINLWQFVIQWCTNFLFVWCFRKFLSIPFICIILHRSYKTNHIKSTWLKSHFTNNNYLFFFKSKTCKSTTSNWNLWSKYYYYFIVIMCIILLYSSATKKNYKKITQIHGELMEKTFWNILIAAFLGRKFLISKQKSVARLFVC